MLHFTPGSWLSSSDSNGYGSCPSCLVDGRPAAAIRFRLGDFFQTERGSEFMHDGCFHCLLSFRKSTTPVDKLVRNRPCQAARNRQDEVQKAHSIRKQCMLHGILFLAGMKRHELVS